MAAVGIGRIVGERDAIEGVDAKKGMIVAATPFAAKSRRWLAHSISPGFLKQQRRDCQIDYEWRRQRS